MRFRLFSARGFGRRVEAAGGQLQFAYAFTDTVLRPARPCRKAEGGVVLRLREERRPQFRCRLLLSSGEVHRTQGFAVKRSALPAGKVPLYEGGRGDALRVARALGFEPAFRIRHERGRAWTLPGGVEVVLERVHAYGGGRGVDLGWWVELAVPDGPLARRRLASALMRLGLDPRSAVAQGLPEVARRALAGATKSCVEPPRSNPRRRRP